MFGDEGYTTLFHLRKMPVRLHWSFPLGMIMVGGLRFVPGIWLAYFIMVAGHELGHGLLARRYGCAVVSLDVHGFGGLCSYVGETTEYERSVIAWGGVLAQAMLFALTMAIITFVGPARTDFSADMVHVFTRVNLIIAAINLLPLNGLDGARAWKLPGLWWRQRGPRRTSTPHPDDLAAGLAQKLRTRAPGPFTKAEGVDEARVVRIERGSDGQVRIVVDGNDSDTRH
jgi:hypothetical protein